MIHALTPYPAMKDSGVPWLGQVPEHWSMKRLDKLFQLRREEPQPDDQRVTGYLDGRVTLRTNVKGQKIKGVIKEAGWQRIHPGDFAISGMNAHLGGMGVSDSLGKCSPIYLVLEPGPETNAQFVSLAVRHLALSGVIKSLVQTIRFNSADFKRDDLKKMDVWLPTSAEQAAIVRYLDHADRRIRRTIAAKQKLIKLLQEQKQVIIHQAVTRGLDPNVKLKPSGVEWLGDVPEGWEVKRIKSLSPVKRGASPRPIADLKYFDQDGEYAWVRIADVTASGRYLLETTERLSDLGKSLSVPLEPSALFLSIAGSVGKPIITKIKCCIHDGFVYFPYFKGNSEFLYYIFLSGALFRGLGKMGTQLNLNTETVGSIQIVWPSKDEQAQIVAYLDEKLAQFDELISHAQTEISLLREYRTRLIADVVTGKLDVRDAAALLPEVEALPEELEAELGVEEVEDEELEGDGEAGEE